MRYIKWAHESATGLALWVSLHFQSSRASPFFTPILIELKTWWLSPDYTIFSRLRRVPCFVDTNTMDVVEGAAAAAASQPTSQSTPSVTVTAPTTTSPSPSKKRSLLTLDLNGPTAGQSQASSTAATLTIPAGVDFRPSPGFVLTSPDVQMLQLASPELEKYIIQGLMGQNTPTPTKLVFPQNVTEEQGKNVTFWGGGRVCHGLSRLIDWLRCILLN